MQFNFQQKREIFENGYTIIRGAVPQVMIDAARRAINHSVGQGMNVDEMTTFRAQSYCPDVKNTAVISDLFNKTPVFSLTESVIGEGNFNPAGGGQIALRFPIMKDPPPKPGPHLDGFPTPTNGVPEGTIANFTALVGVLLSDLPESNAGNFTVWPGTHRSTEKYFQERGADAFLEGFPQSGRCSFLPLSIGARHRAQCFAQHSLRHFLSCEASCAQLARQRNPFQHLDGLARYAGHYTSLTTNTYQSTLIIQVATYGGEFIRRQKKCQPTLTITPSAQADDLL
jgi:hypothetical protein